MFCHILVTCIEFVLSSCGKLFAIFFQINEFRRFHSSAHKDEKPNNSFPKIQSENF